MRPSQIKLIHDLLDRVHEKVDWLNHEANIADHYHAQGSRSGPSASGPVSGTTEPDLRVAGHALHSDKYAKACRSQLSTILRDLYRHLDRDPAKEADQQQTA